MGALSPAPLLHAAAPELRRQEDGKKAQPGSGILWAADKAPAGEKGEGGGLRKGVQRDTGISYNELLSSMNRGLSSTRSQWLCF